MGLLFGGLLNQFAWVMMFVASLLSFHFMNAVTNGKLDMRSIIFLVMVVGGIYAMLKGIGRGLKTIWILKYGRIAVGKLLNIESDLADGNGAYKITFEFVVDAIQTYSTTVFTYNPKPEWLAYAFINERKQQLESIGNMPLVGQALKSDIDNIIPEAEKVVLSSGEIPQAIILFDPNDATQSIVPIGMYGDIDINEAGNIRVYDPFHIIVTSLAVPFLAIVIHIFIIAGRLFY